MRFPALALAAGLTCAATLGPRTALADEPVRPTHVDSGLYPPSGTQLNLALVGLGVTSFWYGAALGSSYAWPDAPGAADLRIPIAGPWMALGETGCADDDPNCSTFTMVLRAILTTIDAVGQTGGVLAVAEAAFMPTQEAASPKARPLPRLRRARGAEVRPVPYAAGKDALGFGLVGQF